MVPILVKNCLKKLYTYWRSICTLSNGTSTGKIFALTNGTKIGKHFCQILKKLKNCESFLILLKWRNFTKCSHTGLQPHLLPWITHQNIAQLQRPHWRQKRFIVFVPRNVGWAVVSGKVKIWCLQKCPNVRGHSCEASTTVNYDSRICKQFPRKCESSVVIYDRWGFIGLSIGQVSLHIPGLFLLGRAIRNSWQNMHDRLFSS